MNPSRTEIERARDRCHGRDFDETLFRRWMREFAEQHPLRYERLRGAAMLWDLERRFRNDN